MSLEITCPVCNFEHIPQERDTCPQCDADLVCFKLLDVLSEKKQEPRMNLAQKSGPSFSFVPEPEDETWENNKNGYADDPGRDRGNFSWIWLAAAIIFLLLTLSSFGYLFQDLSEMKNMIRQHGTFLNQTIVLRKKESDVNLDRLESLSIKLTVVENQAQKVYDLLQENGERLNDIDMMQKKVLTGIQTDTGKVEDTGADHDEKAIKIAEAEGMDSGALNLPEKEAAGVESNALNRPEGEAVAVESKALNRPEGEAGAVLNENNGSDQPKVLTMKNHSSENQVISKSPTLCFKRYRATDKDTLWNIAKALYGQGIYYPVLLEQNPDLRIFDISSKDILRYLCDKRQAARIYKKITAMKNNKLYWKYTLRPGDTRSSVRERYCSKSKACFVEDAFPEIGKTIGIFLE